MADNEVIIDISARLDKAEAALKKLEGEARDSGQRAGDNFTSGYGDALGALATIGAAAVAAAVAAITVAFAKGTAAAIEQENAINDLNNSLARSNSYTAAASQDFQDFASKLQLTTRYADEQIESNAALLESIAHLSEDGLKQATKAALDLSAATGKDLNTSVMLIAKAAEGNVTAFQRMGISIQQGSSNAETFANTMQKLAVFQGAAEAQANTFAGKVDILKNQFGELEESIGNLIIKSPEINALFKLVIEGVQGAIQAVDGFAKSGGLRGAILSIIDFGEAVNKYFVAPVELGYNVARVAIDAVATFIQSGIAKITGGVAGLFNLIGQVTDKFDGIKDFANTLADSTNDALNDLATKTGKDAEDIFDFSGAAAGQSFIDKLRDTVEHAPPITVPQPKNMKIEDPFIGVSFDRLVQSFRMSTDQMNALAKNTTTQLKTTFVSGIGSAFSAIGAALVTGENVFGAFGKAILGMFGDLALQLGQFYLVLGLANLFLNPAAAAAELAGGGGGSGAAVSADTATSGGAASAPIGTSTSNLQQNDGKPNTGVVVNIQGDVLDRRETGMAIVDILNDSFANNGTLLASSGAA